MSILSIIMLVWAVFGTITGIWSLLTDIPLDNENWRHKVGIFAVSLVTGPIGFVMTVYQELSTRV